MASESKIKQFTQEAGYEPLGGRCIIVRPTSGNLHQSVPNSRKFCVIIFYVILLSPLCFCRHRADVHRTSCALIF